jgi:hypothetical protein
MSSIVVSADCNRDAVRESRPTLVEHENSAARGEPFDVAPEQRLVPGREQVSGDPAHEDHVETPVTDDLIRDRDIAATGVAHLGRKHGGSLVDRSRSLAACRRISCSRGPVRQRESA